MRPPVLGMLGHEFDELVLDLLIDDDTGRRGADLPGIVEHARRRRRGRLVDIGDISENDVGRLAAGLERDMLHVAFARIAQKILADFGRAGEGDHIDIHMTAERLAGGLAEARKHVEHAIGNAGFGGEFGEAKGVKRRLLGRLQDDRVAGRECRPKLPGRHHQRKVPRHNRADDADRLAGDHRNRVGAGRGQFIIHLVGVSAYHCRQRIEAARSTDLASEIGLPTSSVSRTPALRDAYRPAPPI